VSWFAPTQTYVETIWEISPPDEKKKEPGKGATAEITLRPLNAGDQADIMDILRTEYGDEDKSQLAIGSMRMLAVERAVIDWTIPGPKPSPESIRALSPPVFEQVYGAVRLGDVHPTLPQAVAGKSNGEGPGNVVESSARRRSPSSTAVP